jgi:hypothetical protein
MSPTQRVLINPKPDGYIKVKSLVEQAAGDILAVVGGSVQSWRAQGAIFRLLGVPTRGGGWAEVGAEACVPIT